MTAQILSSTNTLQKGGKAKLSNPNYHFFRGTIETRGICLVGNHTFQRPDKKFNKIYQFTKNPTTILEINALFTFNMR